MSLSGLPRPSDWDLLSRTDATEPATAPAIVRPLAADDIEEVAALFLRVFRGERAEGAPAVAACLTQVLRPAAGPGGHVYCGGRAVHGFVGALSLRYRAEGRPLQAIMGGMLMLDPRHRGDAMALIRLLRAFFDHPCDLFFTDTASAVSRGVLERLGATFLPLHSIDWVVVRSRAGLAMRMGLDRTRIRALDAALGRAVRGWTGWSRPEAPRRRRRSEARLVTPAPAELAEAVIQLSDAYALHPDWRAERVALDLRLAEAGRQRRHGPLRAKLLLDAGGAPAGCWIAHLRPGAVGRVLQVLGPPGRMDLLLADLLEEAAGIGCVALRGRVQPGLLPVLTRRRTVFMPRLATLVRSPDTALVAMAAEAPALLTGLAGETWSRLFDDDLG